MSAFQKYTFWVTLIILAIFFQIIPAVFSHQYVLLTIFSALPVYLITRASGPLGLVAFIAAAISIFWINSHEGLFFLFTNGPVGLVLGLAGYLKKGNLAASLFTGIILTITLSLLNFVIGIKVFGTNLPGPPGIQILLIWLFSVIYCMIFSYMAGFVYRSLPKGR